MIYQSRLDLAKETILIQPQDGKIRFEFLVDLLTILWGQQGNFFINICGKFSASTKIFINYFLLH